MFYIMDFLLRFLTRGMKCLRLLPVTRCIIRWIKINKNYSRNFYTIHFVVGMTFIRNWGGGGDDLIMKNIVYWYKSGKKRLELIKICNN